MRTLRGHQEAAAGTAVLMLAVVLTAPLHYGFGLALTWLLPAADFGVVSVLLTVLLLATTVLAAGFPWALARTVARAEDGDPEAAAEVDAAFRSALVGNVGLGAALALGFAGVQLTTGAILPGVGAGVTLLAAGTIVLVAIGQVLLGGLQGARRFAAVSGARVVEVLVKVVVGAGAVALIGSGAVGVGWGLLLGAAAAALWAWWTMRDRLPRLRGALAGWRSFAAAAPMAVGTTGFGLIATLDVLLLGPLGHAHGVTFAAIGTYQAAALLAKAPFLVGSTLSDAVFPFIARARGAAEAHGWVVAAMRWVPLALVPVLLVLVVTPDALVGRIFPVEHAAAGNLARLIAVGTLGLVVGDMLLKALFARGLAGTAAARIPAAAIAEVATMALLVPGYGATGAAAGFAVGAWVGVGALGTVYLRHHRPGTLPARAAAGWLVAATGLTGVLALAAHAGPALDLAFIALALVVYAVLAVRLGAVPAAELDRARAWIARATGASARVEAGEGAGDLGHLLAQGDRGEHLDLGAEAQQLGAGVGERLDRDDRAHPAVVVGRPAALGDRAGGVRAQEGRGELQRPRGQAHGRLGLIEGLGELLGAPVPVLPEVEVRGPVEAHVERLERQDASDAVGARRRAGLVSVGEGHQVPGAGFEDDPERLELALHLRLAPAGGPAAVAHAQHPLVPHRVRDAGERGDVVGLAEPAGGIEVEALGDPARAVRELAG